MGDCCSSEPGQVRDANTVPPSEQQRMKPSPNIYTLNAEGSFDSSSSQVEDIVGSIEYQWKKAVMASDNVKIRTLFKTYHKKVRFFEIEFDNGDTALHYAARQNNTKLVKFFLILHMNIDQVNEKSGKTALHEAAIANNPSVVKLLLKNNPSCDVTIKDNNDETALDIAKSKSHDAIVTLLSTKSDTRAQGEKAAPPGPDSQDREPASGRDKGIKTKQGSSEIFGLGRDTNVKSSDDYDNANDEGPTIPIGHNTALLSDYSSEIQSSDINRVVLSGFLEKRRNKAPRTWQNRWVMVNPPYILWSEKKIDSAQEMKNKQKSFIQFSQIVTVIGQKSKKNIENKFVINVRNNKNGSGGSKSEDEDESGTQMREYLFRCDTTQVRNTWVQQINKSLKEYLLAKTVSNATAALR